MMSKPVGTKIDGKRSYSAPTLSVYGGIVELTAAGSMGAAEGTSMTTTKLKP